MAEVRPVGPLTGALPAKESTTIQAAKRAQWTVILGTLVSLFMEHADTVQAALVTFIPPAYYGIAVAGVQLATAVGTFFFGKKAIHGRIEATQRIVVEKKPTSGLPMFLILLALLFVVIFGAGRVLAAPKPITFKWTYTGQAAPDGFRLYQGATPAAVTTKIADISGGSVRQYVLNRTDATPLCYGLSAFNGDGESDITTKRDDGTPVCLGKPQAPSAWNAQL